MFSLLVTSMAIALVVALAAIAIYYGGSSYADARVKADASSLVSQGSQVKAAVEMHRLDHSRVPANIQELVDGSYLKAAIVEELWSTQNGFAMVSGVTQERCLEANRQMQINEVPSCQNPVYVNRAVCCEMVNGSVSPEEPPAP